MTVTVTADYSGLDAYIKNMPLKVDEAVRGTAFFVEGVAKTKAPLLTGALRNSIYVRTHRESGFGAAQTKAKALNSAAETLPEVDAPPLGTALITPAMEYAYFVEFGTSRRGAKPYLTPAMREAAAIFVRLLKKALQP